MDKPRFSNIEVKSIHKDGTMLLVEENLGNIRSVEVEVEENGEKRFDKFDIKK